MHDLLEVVHRYIETISTDDDCEINNTCRRTVGLERRERVYIVLVSSLPNSI